MRSLKHDTTTGDPEPFWNNLLDNLQQFVDAGKDAPGVDPWDKDPDHNWKPPRKDRNGGRPGVSENGGLK